MVAVCISEMMHVCSHSNEGIAHQLIAVPLEK